MIEVYRGSCNTWECDENGHMNVRFYVARMMEGLAEFAHAAGLSHAFRAQARSTLAPRDQHIRFIREALAAQPFSMKACVLEVTDTSVLVYQQIDHATGEPCASYRTWIDHIDIESWTPFPWSDPTRFALDRLKGKPPAACAPRSIDMAVPPRPAARMADADAISAPLLGRGVFAREECDSTGRLRAEFFISRISDSVSHLLQSWREEAATAARARGETVRTGGAVLEYRIVYRRWPKAGDRFVIRSSRGFQKEKVHSFVHWILDPESGEAWCTSEAVAVALNLETRKIIPTSPEQMALLAQIVPEGLAV